MRSLSKFIPVAVSLLPGCASEVGETESESTSEAAYSRRTTVLSCGGTNLPFVSVSRPSSVALQSGVAGRLNLVWSAGFAYGLTMSSPRADTLRFEGSNADRTSFSVVEASHFSLDSNRANYFDVLVGSVTVRTGGVSRVFSDCRSKQEVLAFVR